MVFTVGGESRDNNSLWAASSGQGGSEQPKPSSPETSSQLSYGGSYLGLLCLPIDPTYEATIDQVAHQAPHCHGCRP